MLIQEMKDTGYSWVILFAAFMLNMHYAGGIGTAGVLLLAFIDEFDCPKAELTPIIGLLMCLGFILGTYKYLLLCLRST